MMKNAAVVVGLALVLGALAIGCNSKHEAESKEEAPAQFKSSAIQAAPREQVAEAKAPDAAGERQGAGGEGREAVLPLAIPSTDARLVRFELASGIVEREPVGVAQSFSRSSTPRVFAFVEAANKHGRPFELEIRFEATEATTKGRGFKLAIPDAERWRTQALMATRKAGTYRAVVSAPDGSELMVREFTVSD